LITVINYKKLHVHYTILWALFLDQDYVRGQSLGTIWDCCERPGATMTSTRFLDPDYVRGQILGAIWDCCERPGATMTSTRFLDPDYVRGQSLRAFWNLFEGPGLPITWHQNIEHKGFVLRPRCIVTDRARTQLLL